MQTPHNRERRGEPPARSAERGVAPQPRRTPPEGAAGSAGRTVGALSPASRTAPGPSPRAAVPQRQAAAARKRCALPAPSGDAALGPVGSRRVVPRGGMAEGKREALSQHELRKRLYQTFKNRGVLDTLKVCVVWRRALPVIRRNGESGDVLR